MDWIKRVPGTSEGLSGTNLVRAGEHNQRVILHAIRSNGPITRAELGRITGLTAPAVATITKRLLEETIVRKAGRVLGGRGQPAMMLEIRPEGAFALGLNIDRDHISLVAADFSGRVTQRACIESHFALPEEVLHFVQMQIEIWVKAKAFPKARLAGIGIGIPDKLGDIPLPNKPASYEIWSRIDVGAFFSSALDLPAYLENDATAAAIGELHHSGGGDSQNFIFTLMSAGLGSGLIFRGQPYRGVSGRSGEIAFIPRNLSSSGIDAGIIQDHLSVYALYAYLNDHGMGASKPSDIRIDDPRQAPLIEAWAERAAEELLTCAAVITCVLDPDAHIIGGRLPLPVIERICAHLNRKLTERLPRVPVIAPVRPAKASEDAASLGAAMLVFQNRYLPTPEVLMKPEIA